MRAITGIGSLDFSSMAPNEVVLAVVADDKVVRLWKRRQGLQVSIPYAREELTAAELEVVTQHELGTGGAE